MKQLCFKSECCRAFLKHISSDLLLEELLNLCLCLMILFASIFTHKTATWPLLPNTHLLEHYVMFPKVEMTGWLGKLTPAVTWSRIKADLSPRVLELFWKTSFHSVYIFLSSAVGAELCVGNSGKTLQANWRLWQRPKSLWRGVSLCDPCCQLHASDKLFLDNCVNSSNHFPRIVVQVENNKKKRKKNLKIKEENLHVWICSTICEWQLLLPVA